MADIKISELGAALTVGDSDVLPMTASGVTSKVSTSLIKDYVIGTTDISAIGDGTVTGAIDAINTDMPDGLDDLDDVTITTPADGEAPVYDSVSQKFKNTAIVTQDEFGDVIAPIEVSPSAHAYSVGKQLIYNDTLYKVIAPIAVNDALVVDTNIEVSPKTVIEQVDENKKAISQLSNENLLDNPWFTVNQRGLASYGGANEHVYTVDRFRIYHGTVTVSDGYITLTPSTGTIFYQVMEKTNMKKLLGKKVTVSVLKQDNTLYSGTITLPNSLPASFTSYTVFSNSEMDIVVSLQDNDTLNQPIRIGVKQTVSIKAVKFEIGEYSTLLADSAPNYGDELLKCQYYFVRIKGVNNNILANGWFTDASYANFVVPLPRPMRTIPAASINGTIYVWSPTKLGAGAYQSSTLYASNYSNNGVEVLAISISGTETVGNNAMAQFRDTTSYIDLSADF